MTNTHNSGTGKIKLIIGPMYSSKTTTMLSDIERQLIAGKKCLIIKHSKDTRYNSDSVVTHSGYHANNRADVLIADDLSKCNVLDYNVVAITEINFFENVPHIIDKWANSGIYVILEGLSGDYKREVFGCIGNIIPLCEEIIKLNAVCEKCFADGSFSARIVDDSQQLLVGGKESYIAVCRKCYMETRGEN